MVTSRTSSSPRGSAGARSAVIEMLSADRARAKQAFKQFDKLDSESDRDPCLQIVRQACADLSLHTTREEECFYPAIRAALARSGLVDEANVEHAGANQLIAQLARAADIDWRELRDRMVERRQQLQAALTGDSDDVATMPSAAQRGSGIRSFRAASARQASQSRPQAAGGSRRRASSDDVESQEEDEEAP